MVSHDPDVYIVPCDVQVAHHHSVLLRELSIDGLRSLAPDVDSWEFSLNHLVDFNRCVLVYPQVDVVVLVELAYFVKNASEYNVVAFKVFCFFAVGES